MAEVATLDRDIVAFKKMRSELEKHHHGKWVLFYDEQYIGAFDSFDQTAQEAVRWFGRGPYLIRQVGAPPITLPASVMYHPVRATD